MFPVALTCPLWWVARWATRVLTSLAVLSLALGAAPALLPASAAPVSPSTVQSPALADRLVRTTAVTVTATAGRLLADRTAAQRASADRAAADRAAADRAAADRAAADRAASQRASADQATTQRAGAEQAARRAAVGPVSRASVAEAAAGPVSRVSAADAAAAGVLPARPVDPQPALLGAPGLLPGPPTAVTSVGTGAERSLRAAGSAGRTPRAPPA
ncbi:hypothetical protein [Micromonospora sp. bgisy143]|uniref:hypothetical protein n=1 Tax=Micromonospora sp. bgisy143 TaxID=3413790 RepID=UPI003EBDAF22